MVKKKTETRLSNCLGRAQQSMYIAVQKKFVLHNSKFEIESVIEDRIVRLLG